MGGKLRYLSRLEHVLIVSFAGLLVLFVYGQFISDIITHYTWSNTHFGPPGNFVGGFHLVSMLVFLGLILGRKFYVALLLTLAYLATLLYAHYSRFGDFESALNGWEADAFNLVVFVVLLVLLIWQLTIILRVVRQTLNASKLA